MKDGQELVEAKSTEIQVFSEFDARIAELKEHLVNKEYDLTTGEGKDEAEKDKGSLRDVEIKIEKKRKLEGAGLLKATKKLNADAKVWHNKVHDLWEIIDKPLQIIRQSELDAAMDKMEADKAEAKAIQDAKDAELEKLRAVVAKQESDAKATRDAAERKEELEAAALLAAQNEKIQAEQAALLAKGIAQQEKINAVAEVERKAKAEADALAKKAADLYAKEQAEQRKIDADLLAKQQDVEHQKEFNNLALDVIVALTGDPATSLRIVKAIVSNEVPNVTMNY